MRIAFALFLATLAFSSVAAAQVHVSVDAASTHQTMEGFGATTMSLAYADVDNVPAALRTQAIDALYGQVRLNLGSVMVEPCEASPTNVFAPANDDSDPFVTRAGGFNWIQSDNVHGLVVAPGIPLGFTDWWLGPVIQTGYAMSWAPAIRGVDRARYLDELAEHVLAVVTHWRDAYGLTPRFVQLFNEPTSGNHELAGGDAAELRDIVRVVGARLVSGGFPSMRIVVPAEETEEISLANAMTILADAAAASHVGAIAYHPYPYGSRYASVPNILASSGMGTPDAAEVAVRASLRDLGAAHGIPVFMAEVSHSELPFDDFRNVLGRAIHVHDELVYADAAAFFGMNAMWDTVSHAQHYAGRPDPGFWTETDTIVLVDVGAARVVISPMGRAIGHYARFLRRGAVRVGATTDDARVLVTAFREPTLSRIVVVAINANGSSRNLQLSIAGATVGATFDGELSTSTTPWAPVTGVVASGASTFAMPASSVVTLSFPLATAGPDAGTDAAMLVDAAVAVDAAIDIDAGVDAASDTDAATEIDAATDVDAASVSDAATPGADARVTPADGSVLADASRRDAATGDAGSAPVAAAGCGCVVGARGDARGPALFVLGLALIAARRRQRA